MRTISVSTALFDGYPMEQAIEEVALAGARSVEPAFIKGYVEFDESVFLAQGARRMRSLLEAAALPVTAVSAHLDLGRENAREMLERRVRYAADIGARFLITNTGAASRRAEILSVLESVIGLCEQSDVVIALENPGHGTGDLIGNGRMAAEILADLGSPSIRMNYDVGNIFTYSRESLSPHDDFPRARDHVSHLHLKDVASVGGDWHFTAIGDGAIDYASLWPLLPPELPVALELPLRLKRPGRADPVRQPQPLELATIRDALRKSVSNVMAWD